MTEDNFIDFKCPHCGTDTAFLDRFAGAVDAVSIITPNK